MGTDNADGNRRGIEAVTRLYLSDPGRNAASGSRRGPRQIAQQHLGCNYEEDFPASTNQARQDHHDPQCSAEDRNLLDAGPGGIVLLTDHLGTVQACAQEYTAQLAEAGKRVLLLRVDPESVQLIECDPMPSQDSACVSQQDMPNAGTTGGHVDAAELDALFENIDRGEHDPTAQCKGTDDALSSALDGIADRDGVLVVNPVGMDDEVVLRLIEGCDSVTVLATPQRDGIVAAYAKLKWLAAFPEARPTVEILVCRCENTQQASEVYTRLAGAVEKFLQLPVALAGCSGGSRPEVTPRELWIGEFSESVMGDVMKHLDEKTRGADVSVSDLAKETPTALPAWREGYLWPIMVDAFPTTDSELTRCLEASIGRWLLWLPGALVLPLALPAEFGADVRLLLDGTGRVHIFCATLFGDDAVLRNTLAVRHWFRENIELVAETFPQVKIDRSLGVEILLIAGGDSQAIRRRLDSIADCPVLFRYLHRLRNELGSSLLVTE